MCTIPERVKNGNASLALQADGTASVVRSLTHIFEETGPGTYRLSFDLYGGNEGTVVHASFAVKGSGDDHTDLPWWAPMTTVTNMTTAEKGRWTTVTMDFDLSWQGLIEMAKFELQANGADGADACIDNVQLVKRDVINGERLACVQRDEGCYTLLNVSVS